MYPGVIYINLDSINVGPADLKTLAASGHDIVLLSNDSGQEGTIRRGLAATITYTIITKPAIQAVDEEQWKAISIYAIARLMGAVKLHLIGDISAPVSLTYTVEQYASVAEAIRGIK